MKKRVASSDYSKTPFASPNGSAASITRGK